MADRTIRVNGGGETIKVTTNRNAVRVKTSEGPRGASGADGTNYLTQLQALELVSGGVCGLHFHATSGIVDFGTAVSGIVTGYTGGAVSYPVTSVNGLTGAVTINVPVSSVNSHTGAVVLDVSDFASFNSAVSGIASGYFNQVSYPVTSVNGSTGAVVLSTTEIAEGSNQYFSTERAQDAFNSMFQNSSSISGVYDDASNTFTLYALNSAINYLTQAQANELVSGGNSTLHYHDTDRSRTNHTGQQAASTISDWSIAVTGSVASGMTTDGLTEGVNNKYFTDERVDDRVANLVGTSSTISGRYDDGANVFYLDAIPSGINYLTQSQATALTTSGSATTLHKHTRTAELGITIDGNGSAITTGLKYYLRVPFACTITSATLYADQTGSIVIDVWKDTYANFPPTVADTITASAKPTLSSAQKNQDTTLTGWTTTINAGDFLAFNVDSASTVTWVQLVLQVSVIE